MFQASLINDPFGDPGVFLALRYRPEAFLFDLGDLAALSPRQLLKVGHVFVSHTHMDHFVGFDRLLRISLGRDRRIDLFGPPGILDQVACRLGSYIWNLVGHYAKVFTLAVTEVAEGGRLRTRCHHSHNAFQPERERETQILDGVIAQGRFFTVRAVQLDHQVPSLAFRWEEKLGIHIKKNALNDMGLPPGPWLFGLKERILADDPDDTPVLAWWKEGHGARRERSLPLGTLRERAVLTVPGQRVAYVTDALFSEENAERIVALAAGAERLFIEAPFLDRDRQRARQKHHLTARQAGLLARRSGVKRFDLFHFSPKYHGMGAALIAEALAAFKGVPGDAEGAGGSEEGEEARIRGGRSGNPPA